MYEYLHVLNVCLVSEEKRPEEGTQFHGTRVMGGCKLSYGLESKPRSLSALNY